MYINSLFYFVMSVKLQTLFDLQNSEIQVCFITHLIGMESNTDKIHFGCFLSENYFLFLIKPVLVLFIKPSFWIGGNDCCLLPLLSLISFMFYFSYVLLWLGVHEPVNWKTHKLIWLLNNGNHLQWLPLLNSSLISRLANQLNYCTICSSKQCGYQWFRYLFVICR